MKTNTLEINLIREDSEFLATLTLTHTGLLELNNLDFLHASELTRFQTLKSPLRQKTFLAGRLCAKEAINNHIKNIKSSDILVSSGIFDQPLVNIPDIQISLSHTDDLAACIVFPEAHPMGIDIEKIDDDKIQTIETQLTETEKNLIETKKINHPEMVLWTAKEALSKVLKVGLMTPFQLLEITSTEEKEDFVESHFDNFAQYKALSFQVHDHILSIICPKRSEFVCDFQKIKKLF